MATILETINQVLNYENEPERRRELLKNTFELTEEQVAAIMQAIESKADQAGTYENLTAGYALHLLSTDYTEDKTPYIFRKSGGSADIGSIEEDTIIGGSVVWNQLVAFINHVYEHSDLNVISNAKENTLTIDGTTSEIINLDLDGIFWQSITMADTRKYLAKLIPISGTTDGEFLINLTGSSSNNPTEGGVIINGNPGQANNHWISIKPGTYTNYKVRVNIFDITLMFGFTIANLIYNKEKSTAGKGIAWLKSMGFFVKDYYPFDAGTFKSVESLISHDTIGFNQWDEEWELGIYNITTGEKESSSGQIRCKNGIPVIPNATYYLKVPYSSTLTNFCRGLLYDADDNFVGTIPNFNSNGILYTVPNNVHYIRFFVTVIYGTTYKNDICINLSGPRNGEYEAYTKHSYPLDSSLVLRGAPVTVYSNGSNNLFYYGDVYRADGSVERKYSVEIDLETLTWVSDDSRPGVFFSPSLASLINLSSEIDIICSKYPLRNYDLSRMWDKTISTATSYGSGFICIKDSAFNGYTVEQVASALSGEKLIYALRTPTIENAQPFTSRQVVNSSGTEQYVIDSDVTVPVPVGHDTKYLADLRDKVEQLPYIPSAPETNGTYTLKCTVSGGSPVYTWESET